MLYGRAVGLVLFFFGVLLSVLMVAMLFLSGSVIRFLLAGPAMGLLGLGMLIFPGGKLTYQESRREDFEASDFFSNAPLFHKIMWTLLLVAGFIIAFSFLG